MAEAGPEPGKAGPGQNRSASKSVCPPGSGARPAALLPTSLCRQMGISDRSLSFPLCFVPCRSPTSSPPHPNSALVSPPPQGYKGPSCICLFLVTSCESAITSKQGIGNKIHSKSGLKNEPSRSSCRGSVVMNPTPIHEDSGLIPGLVQWLEDPTLL